MLSRVLAVASMLIAFGGMCAFMDMGGSMVRKVLPAGFPQPQRTSPVIFAGIGPKATPLLHGHPRS